jgi:glycosyltransferase involved in cell wall biosynthesis
MRKKICFVVAVPITAQAFLKDHIKLLSEHYDVFLLANIKSDDEVRGLSLTGWKKIEIERGISIKKDMDAVVQLKRYFQEMQFDAVHSVTPKAGLVTALAGKLAGIKHRTHIFTGQVWATKSGLMRWLLKSIDKLIARCDNHIMVDGKSQRTFLEKEGVLKPGKALVFCEGSIAGVNSERFVPDANARKEEREKIGIKDGVLTYIFLGRLNHDKGIGELYEAYNRLAAEEKDVFLLLVGFDEEGYLQKLPEYKNIQEGKNFHFYGSTSQPEHVLNAGDVFVLPTYREGFGSSVLEAACIGLPSICTDAYGVLDAYIEGETGLQCKVGDVESLYQCMKRMHDEQELRINMGKKSRERALKDFNVKPISEAWFNFYKNILG